MTLSFARPLAAAVRHGHSDYVLAGIDSALIAAAWSTAVLLRYDAQVPEQAWSGLWAVLPVAVLITVLSNGLTGLYAGVWRHASIYEARRVVIAQLGALTVLLPMNLALGRLVPFSVPVIACLLTIALVGAVRFQSRLFAFRIRETRDPAATVATADIVVIGAGSAGVSLAREVNTRRSSTRVVAFLDDDPQLLGRRLLGVPVRGTLADLAEVARQQQASYAVVAIPSATSEAVRKVASIAESEGIVLRAVPPLAELANGEVHLKDVRDIEISDLLTRGQVQTDLAEVTELVQGRCVLVTGAGGSIGSEIARQVARLGASRLVLVDHDETHLFDTAAELPADTVQRLADIREPTALGQIFAQEQPDIVFHAAAHKHVPLLEDHPVEAALTNVFGTETVVNAAREAGVSRFVFISTDKAVRPSSVMGASKAVAEQVVLGGSGDMTACAVRFGNVLGSRGSVVPTFVRQIRSGGPVTVTDARMTRYFMSIPEAVRLVLHAASLADGGEIFMLDMGEAVPILDLAKRMIRLSGNRPGLDVEIRVTGIRPGEKLAEQLHTADEQEHLTAHPSIVRLTPVLPPAAQLATRLQQLAKAVERRDNQATRAELVELAAARIPPRLPDQRPGSPVLVSQRA